jgi:hypothetical protein
MDLTDEQLLKLSKAKDGDVVVVSSDSATPDQLNTLGKEIRKRTGKNIFVIGLPAGDTITLLEAHEARTILEYLAKKGPTP